MSAEELRLVKQAFLDEYGHFADRRIRNIDKGSLFVVDDRQGRGSDYGADGQLFGWFCEILSEVKHPDVIVVTLRGAIPVGPTVESWMRSNGLKITRQPYGVKNILDFKVGRSNLEELLTLSNAFESITARGARYSVPAYKYVCPRTAASITRLHRLLVKCWSPQD